jgi:hypothetical protein
VWLEKLCTACSSSSPKLSQKMTAISASSQLVE